MEKFFKKGKKMERKEVYEREELRQMLGYSMHYLAKPVMRQRLPFAKDIQNGRVMYQRENILKYLKSVRNSIKNKEELIALLS